MDEPKDELTPPVDPDLDEPRALSFDLGVEVEGSPSSGARQLLWRADVSDAELPQTVELAALGRPKAAEQDEEGGDSEEAHQLDPQEPAGAEFGIVRVRTAPQPLVFEFGVEVEELPPGIDTLLPQQNIDDVKNPVTAPAHAAVRRKVLTFILTLGLLGGGLSLLNPLNDALDRGATSSPSLGRQPSLLPSSRGADGSRLAPASGVQAMVPASPGTQVMVHTSPTQPSVLGADNDAEIELRRAVATALHACSADEVIDATLLFVRAGPPAAGRFRDGAETGRCSRMALMGLEHRPGEEAEVIRVARVHGVTYLTELFINRPVWEAAVADQVRPGTFPDDSYVPITLQSASGRLVLRAHRAAARGIELPTAPAIAIVSPAPLFDMDFLMMRGRPRLLHFSRHQSTNIAEYGSDALSGVSSRGWIRVDSQPLAAAQTDEIARLLDEAFSEGRAGRPRSPPGSASGGGLTSTPSRSDVVDAMNGVAGRVQGCGDGAYGTVPVNITFGHDGRVDRAVVGSTSLSPVARSCVARAVRAASVPPFQADSFNVNYPFRL